MIGLIEPVAKFEVLDVICVEGRKVGGNRMNRSGP